MSFSKPAPRTNTAFAAAAQMLGAQVVHLNQSTMAMKNKGESFADTLQTVFAMSPAVVVLRHGDSGAADFAARLAPDSIAVANGGDGAHAHPTQGLLDVYTLRRIFQKPLRRQNRRPRRRHFAFASRPQRRRLVARARREFALRRPARLLPAGARARARRRALRRYRRGLARSRRRDFAAHPARANARFVLSILRRLPPRLLPDPRARGANETRRADFAPRADEPRRRNRKRTRRRPALRRLGASQKRHGRAHGRAVDVGRKIDDCRRF